MSFQSLYVGATGLVTHGQGMSVTGNNISNVNTVGFKSSDFHFAELYNKSLATGEGVKGFSQLGLGVGLSDVMPEFAQGSFMQTNETMDLSIGGKGFFRLRDPGDGGTYHYTRAGNFRFDKEGYLVDPHKFRVQGFELSSSGEPLNTLADIALPTDEDGQYSMDPVATSEMSVISNLFSAFTEEEAEPTSLLSILPSLSGAAADMTSDVNNPYFSLLQAWDSDSVPGLTEDQYALSSSIEVIDGNGNPQTLNIYFDRADSTSTASGVGDTGTTFEFVIGMDPSKDASVPAGTPGQGLMMTGTLSFDENGVLTGMTAYTPAEGSEENKAYPSAWTLAEFDQNGYPTFDLTTYDMVDGEPVGDPVTQAISLDMGGSASSTMAWSGGLGSSASAVGQDPANLPNMAGLSGAGSLLMAVGDTSSILEISQNGDTNEVEDPFFTMLSAYDATRADGPLAEDEVTYTVTQKVYDEYGNQHTVNIHYHPAQLESEDGRTHWQYLVSLPPGEDGSAAAGTAGEGLLMAGTLTFDSSGQLLNQSAFTPANPEGDLTDLSNWSAASFSSSGYPEFTATFAGDGTPATSQAIALNMGLRNPSGLWGDSSASPAVIDRDPSLLPGFGGEVESLASTGYEGTSSTTVNLQNGYPEGYLTSLQIGSDGIIYGRYSNGATQGLYQLSVETFQSEYGLYREGGNLFAATQASGPATSNHPGTGPAGDIVSGALEQSNVDLAREFTTMILTQRGFQANGKVVSTSDSLLQTAVNMKR